MTSNIKKIDKDISQIKDSEDINRLHLDALIEQFEMHDDDDIPILDLVNEFDPDNPKVQTNPLHAALSIGMQQMPGGIAGMQRVMGVFMKGAKKDDPKSPFYREDEVQPEEIERMLFNPDQRTLDRILEIMYDRFDEVEELERELIEDHIRKYQELQERVAKKRVEKEKRWKEEREREERERAEAQAKAKQEEREEREERDRTNRDDGDKSEDDDDTDNEPVVENVSEDSAE